VNHILQYVGVATGGHVAEKVGRHRLAALARPLVAICFNACSATSGLSATIPLRFGFARRMPIKRAPFPPPSAGCYRPVSRVGYKGLRAGVMRKRRAGNHFVVAATIALALLLSFGGSTSAEEARDKRRVELPPIACADVVEIRDSAPRIDFEMDEVDVTGDVHVTRGRVQDLKVCLAGNCAPVRGADVLRQGESAQFYLRGPRGRPQKLSVRCTVLDR